MPNWGYNCDVGPLVIKGRAELNLPTSRTRESDSRVAALPKGTGSEVASRDPAEF